MKKDAKDKELALKNEINELQREITTVTNNF